MGNNLTLENQTDNTIEVSMHLAGSGENPLKVSLDSQMKKPYQLHGSFNKSKTVIVIVNDKIGRAVRINRYVRITQSLEGQLMIEMMAENVNMELSLTNIIENKEIEMNWNIVENSVKQDYIKTANEMINIMNNFVTFLGAGFTNVVKLNPIDKGIVDLCAKNVTDAVISFMKTDKLKVMEEKDNRITESLQNIYHQLIGIARAIEIDYPFLKQERQMDNEKSFKFLHKQLMKITNGNILPFLEDSKIEESVMVYIFAIDLGMKIFCEMRKVNDNCTNKLEQRYLSIFSNNLEELWKNILEAITKHTEIKTTGFIIKNAKLKYNNQLVYKIKSFSKSRINNRMGDIKMAFLLNMKYQLDFLYCHPETIIKNCRSLCNSI